VNSTDLLNGWLRASRDRRIAAAKGDRVRAERAATMMRLFGPVGPAAAPHEADGAATPDSRTQFRYGRD